MLGFSPISSRAISGSPFSLVSIAAPMSVVVGLAFGITARIGAFIPMHANLSVTFSGSPMLFVLQAMHATLGLSFGGTSTLFIAGKPIRINALPESFEFRVVKEQWTLKALPQSFNMRGAQ